jgi:hypothetical protein
MGCWGCCTGVINTNQAALTYAAAVESAVTIAHRRRDGQDSGAPPRRGRHILQSAQRRGVELQAASVRIAVVGHRFQEGHSELGAQHREARLKSLNAGVQREIVRLQKCLKSERTENQLGSACRNRFCEWGRCRMLTWWRRAGAALAGWAYLP